MRLVLKILTCLFVSIFTCNVYGNTRDGLKGWWTFDELSGNAFDSSWNGNLGTPTGTTIINTCPKMGCRSFAGGSNYISIADSDTLSFTTGSADLPFSVSIWVNPSSLAANGWIFNKRGNTTNCEYQMVMLTTGAMEMDLFSGGGNTVYIYSQSNSTIAVGGWHNFVWTYDGTGVVGGFNWYLDGVLSAKTTGSAGSYVSMSNGTSVLGIGTSIWAIGTSSYTGYIDDLRVYNRVLTAQEIKDLYNPGVRRNFVPGT